MAGSSSFGIQSTGANDAQLPVEDEEDQDQTLEQAASQRSQMLAQRDTMARAESRAHYSVNGDSSSNPANDGRGLMRPSDLAALAQKPVSADATSDPTSDMNKPKDKDLAKKEKIKAGLEKALADAKGGAEKSQSVYEYPFIVQIHTDAKGKSQVVSTQYIGPASEKHELMGKKGDAERRALGDAGGGAQNDKIKRLQNEIASIDKSIANGTPLDPNDYPDAADGSEDPSSASTGAAGGAIGAASAGPGVDASGGSDTGGIDG